MEAGQGVRFRAATPGQAFKDTLGNFWHEERRLSELKSAASLKTDLGSGMDGLHLCVFKPCSSFRVKMYQGASLSKLYGREADIIFVAGCMLVEMQTGQPLFPGTDDTDQLWLILKSCTDEQLATLQGSTILEVRHSIAPFL